MIDKLKKLICYMIGHDWWYSTGRYFGDGMIPLGTPDKDIKTCTRCKQKGEW